MLISHECPKILLKESRKFNDYDYALVHLFDTEPDYLNFYKESLKMNRIVYLDNSLFELETLFNHRKFADWCRVLSDINSSNFYYIIPDDLENIDSTISSFEKFSTEYDIPGNKIGVVQGSNYNEILECFKFMKSNADVVAVSFDYSFWSEGNKFFDSMNNRIKFIHKLKDDGLLNNTKIHLLGCFLPQEFKHYKDIPEIFSIDTSNPIVHGIKGIRYTEDGLNSKESIKLVDLLNVPSVPDDVFYNIKRFRSFICK